MAAMAALIAVLILPQPPGVTAHRWLYAPDMSRDEVLLLKCYDSLRDGRARFMPHTSFQDPNAPADMNPRESIELRTLVFFDT